MAELSEKDIEDLQQAFKSVYLDQPKVQKFAYDNLNLELEDVTSRYKELPSIVLDLLKQAKSRGLLERLIQKFKNAEEVSNRQDIQQLCTDLLIKLNPLASQERLPNADLDSLFAQFDAAADIPYLQIAFRRAFKQVYNHNFLDMRPDCPPLGDLLALKQMILDYRNPVLAVRFAECAMEVFRNEGSPVNFQAIEAWARATADEFDVPAATTAPDDLTPRQGYLLVTLDSSYPVPDILDVNIYAELYVGEDSVSIKPIQPQGSCTLDQVPHYLSQWIQSSEVALADYRCGKVCIELFLPCHYLEAIPDIADDWKVKRPDNRTRPLEKHRKYVVRSLERAIQPQSQVLLAKNWVQLQRCLEAKNAHEQFHLQDCCPDIGDLENLGDSPGLRLIAELPLDEDERQDILSDIIYSAVPIAFWYGKNNRQLPEDRLAALNSLLQTTELTEFAALAQAWQQIRRQFNVRLLCDHPTRLPKLPDLDNREYDDSLFSAG